MENNNIKLLKIGEAAALIKVDISTLRRWHASGKLTPELVADTKTRWYSEEQLEYFLPLHVCDTYDASSLNKPSPFTVIGYDKDDEYNDEENDECNDEEDGIMSNFHNYSYKIK